MLTLFLTACSTSPFIDLSADFDSALPEWVKPAESVSLTSSVNENEVTFSVYSNDTLVYNTFYIWDGSIGRWKPLLMNESEASTKYVYAKSSTHSLGLDFFASTGYSIRVVMYSCSTGQVNSCRDRRWQYFYQRITGLPMNYSLLPLNNSLLSSTVVVNSTGFFQEGMTIKAKVKYDSHSDDIGGSGTIIAQPRKFGLRAGPTVEYEKLEYYYPFMFNGVGGWDIWTSNNRVLQTGSWKDVVFSYEFGDPNSLVAYVDGIRQAGTWTHHSPLTGQARVAQFPGLTLGANEPLATNFPVRLKSTEMFVFPGRPHPRDGDTIQQLSGDIEYIALWNTRLSDGELEALSTADAWSIVSYEPDLYFAFEPRQTVPVNRSGVGPCYQLKYTAYPLEYIDAGCYLLGMYEDRATSFGVNNRGFDYLGYLDQLAFHNLTYTQIRPYPERADASYCALFNSMRGSYFSDWKEPYVYAGCTNYFNHNFNEFDQDFWNRFESYLQKADELGIFVEVVVTSHNFWGYTQYDMDPINVMSPSQRAAYYDKLFSITTKYRNVIYEVANEGGFRRELAEIRNRRAPNQPIAADIDYMNGYYNRNYGDISISDVDIVNFHLGRTSTINDGFNSFCQSGKPCAQGEDFAGFTPNNKDVEFHKNVAIQTFFKGIHNNHIDWSYWNPRNVWGDTNRISMPPPSILFFKNLIEFQTTKMINFKTIVPSNFASGTGVFSAESGIARFFYAPSSMNVLVNIPSGSYVFTYYDLENGGAYLQETRDGGSVSVSVTQPKTIVLIESDSGLNEGTDEGAIGGDSLMVANFPGGVDDYIEVPHSASLSPTTQLTLAAWIRPTQRRACGGREEWGSVIFFKGLLGSHKNYELIDHCIGLYYSTHSGRAQIPRLPLNQWTHVVVSVDASQRIIAIYLDGVQMSISNQLSQYITPDSHPLYLGGFWQRAWGYNNNNFIGQLDDIAIYNRALLASEVQQLYQRQVPTLGLQAFWNFEDGTALDVSGNNNNGALKGSVRIIDR